MKREYSDVQGQPDSSVKFFTGIEVEHTPQHGALTLFVVGVHPAEQIIALCEKHQCTHVYLGANQSFDTTNIVSWETMARGILNASKLWVTLDFDVAYVNDIHETGLCEQRRFIPVVSVKIPYLAQLGYNATLKIDDTGFDATNPGVWCHPIRDLLKTESFTDWDHYYSDNIIQ